MQRTYDIPVELLSTPRRGTIFDLSSGWWPGMPVAAAHPPFQVVTYRTPRGMRSERLFPYAAGGNAVNYAFVTEIVSSTMHAGTHVDALCHVTCGDDNAWFGGHSADEFLGDHGALCDDASEMPPLVARGLLLDVPAAVRMERLPDGYRVGPDELRTACERQAVEPRAGDAVLVRTGLMRDWPDPLKVVSEQQAGLSIEGARWLQPFRPLLVGSDNTSVECAPSGVDEPQPVHRFLLREHGIYMLEWSYLEDLAQAGISEFLFVCAPLTIKGATGSLVRPLAIV
ncbi:MAG: cyclase family protein [Chloroflexota bacterium]